MLFNGDCLEVMKTLDDNSIDLVFCDLPYGQTSCKWDCKIDLEAFWIQIMRIKKINTPLFFTTTTKFGVELIQSAPKKCFFRYDLVWVKSAPAGFLTAKKMPMRKHEMVYVFYEKLPFYDLSSHTHKFIKDAKNDKKVEPTLYGRMTKPRTRDKTYEPPLPVSVLKEETGGATGKEEIMNSESVLKEGNITITEVERKSTYGNIKTHDIVTGKNNAVARYDPPLPVSVVKVTEGGSCKNYKAERLYYYDENGKKLDGTTPGNTTKYEPPLPDSLLEIKSTRGKHSTEKPVALMEWILKYYSKEGDVVLDPTMGSGSTGVACKNLNRKFIGIEMDAEIFEVAKGRNPDELVKG